VFGCFSCGASPSKHRCRVFDGVTKVPFSSNYQQEECIDLEPFVPPEGYRGLTKQTLEKHGVFFTELAEGKRTAHYTYTNGVKHRELPKTIRISGQMDTFYGQDDYNGSGRTITITEGEEDRLSVIQMMGDYPCVSVPGATPSKAFWENAKKYLQGFEKIYLSVDNDEPGNALADKFYRMLPGKVYRVQHTKYKDANEFLQAGAAQEYKSAWWNAQKLKPADILCTYDDFEKLYNETPDYEYFPTGIPDLDKKIMGIHKGAFTVILAETGIGKTEVFRYLEYKCLKDTNYSLAICHGEETQLRSLLGLVSYDLGANVTRKDLIEAGAYEEQVKESIRNLTRDERLYQFRIRVDEGVDEIVDQVRFLATAFGVDYIFLEPIQDFISAANTSEKESLLTDLTNKLKRLAPELNVGIVVIAHANKDGEAKYCASIIQGAAFEVRLERDPNAEDPQERNRTHVFVGRKNRVGGGSGPAGSLTFDVDTYMLQPDVYESPQEVTRSNDIGF
jgi:5S rRNA maturation endonuclease (ribonuclease M5)